MSNNISNSNYALTMFMITTLNDASDVRFPKWSQGLWEDSLIVNGTMTFTDLNGYNSYTFITVESNEETGRYIVYSKDQW